MLKRWRFPALIAVIVAAHVAMWMSPRMEPEQKLRLTLINAGIWAVVLLPAVGVSMWARQHRERDDDPRD